MKPNLKMNILCPKIRLLRVRKWGHTLINLLNIKIYIQGFPKWNVLLQWRYYTSKDQENASWLKLGVCSRSRALWTSPTWSASYFRVAVQNMNIYRRQILDSGVWPTGSKKSSQGWHNLVNAIVLSLFSNLVKNIHFHEDHCFPHGMNLQ